MQAIAKTLRIGKPAVCRHLQDAQTEWRATDAAAREKFVADRLASLQTLHEMEVQSLKKLEQDASHVHNHIRIMLHAVCKRAQLLEYDAPVGEDKLLTDQELAEIL